MKLIDTFLMAGAVGFLVIGILQTMEVGFANGYWAFMLMIACFFARLWRRGKEVQAQQRQNDEQQNTQRKAKLTQKRKKKRK